MRKLAQSYPLTLFFALSLPLSWWPWALYVYGLSPVPNAGFGPFIAAMIVLGLREGRPGMGRLLRSMVAWRAPLRAYLVAIGLPILISGIAIWLNLAMGAARPSPAATAAWVDIPVTLVLVLLIPGLAGAWEEPGFRGFALGRLERRFGRTVAPLVLGMLWVGWHFPLFMTGQIEPTDVAVVIAASVAIAALFHLGRESVLIAMLLHASNNAVGGGYASQLFTGHDLLRLGWLTAAGWCLVAGTILAVQTARRPRPPRPAREPTAAQPGPITASHRRLRSTSQSPSTP